MFHPGESISDVLDPNEVESAAAFDVVVADDGEKARATSASQCGQCRGAIGGDQIIGWCCYVWLRAKSKVDFVERLWCRLCLLMNGG